MGLTGWEGEKWWLLTGEGEKKLGLCDLWWKKGVTYGALNECPACRVGRTRVIIAH